MVDGAETSTIGPFERRKTFYIWQWHNKGDSQFCHNSLGVLSWPRNRSRARYTGRVTLSQGFVYIARLYLSGMSSGVHEYWWSEMSFDIGCFSLSPVYKIMIDNPTKQTPIAGALGFKTHHPTHSVIHRTTRTPVYPYSMLSYFVQRQKQNKKVAMYTIRIPAILTITT